MKAPPIGHCGQWSFCAFDAPEHGGEGPAGISRDGPTSMNKDRKHCRPPLRQIYFYLTDGCNLLCRHCWIGPKYQTEAETHAALDLALVQSIVRQAKPLGLMGVKLTGGEPLLHPQVREILEFVHSERLRLTLETNGLLCTAELVQTLADCGNVFVAVSLDGADAETHEWIRGIKGCFRAAVESIRRIAEAGLMPQLIMTVMRQNKKQLEAVVRLAERLGAGSVKFNLLQPVARGESMHNAGEALSIEELVSLGRWVETTLAPSTPLSLYYDHPPAFRSLSRLFATNGNGCGVCGVLTILGVLADGSYALCGIGKTVPAMVFGDAEKDLLEDVWGNSPVLIELREGLPGHLDGICRDCLMKGLCLGSCVAQNYLGSKNLWAPFWYCEEAHKRGLFPESRISLRNLLDQDRGWKGQE